MRTNWHHYAMPSHPACALWTVKNDDASAAATTMKARVRSWLLMDKIGALGAVLAAAATPCCFPLLATVGAALGLGAFQSLRGYMDYAIQAMAALALVGNLIAY